MPNITFPCCSLILDKSPSPHPTSPSSPLFFLLVQTSPSLNGGWEDEGEPFHVPPNLTPNLLIYTHNSSCFPLQHFPQGVVTNVCD